MIERSSSSCPAARRFGRTGPELFPIGLGLMGMSDFYGPADRVESLATIRAAFEAGVTQFDTGDFYGSGHNELLLAEALKDLPRQEIFISVKFGALRDPSGGFVGIDNRPAALKNFLAMTLKRLGTDYIDLYQAARFDPAVPVEETVGGIKEMIGAGYVRHLGLSEASAETIRRASSIHPIAALQIEYSLLSRGIETEILPAAREHGVAINAYGVLSRGLLSGHWTPERGSNPHDFRSHLPRFMGDNLAANLALVDALKEIAARKDASVAQVAIAWVLAQGDDILPVIGARRPDRLEEALGALALELTPDDLAQIETAMPAGAAAGERYEEGQMQIIDAERGNV